MLKKYIEYLRDNPKGYWFKSRMFGWGWTPVKWQGWLVVLVFIVFLLWNGTNLADKPDPASEDLTWFFINIAVAVAVLITICFKTGEKPKWHWGFPDKSDKKEKEQQDKF